MIYIASVDLTNFTNTCMVERFAFDQDCLPLKEKDKIKKSEKRKWLILVPGSKDD